MKTPSVRRRGMTALAAGALAAGLGGLLAAPAVAAPPAQDPAPDAQYADAIQLSWDGTYAASTTESFFGVPVTVPGDTASRTLLVRNDGPSDATLRATIIEVNLLDPGAPDVHHNPEHVAPDDSGLYAGAGPQGHFYDDLHLRWDGGSASFSQLHANGRTQILQIPLAQGEQIPITLTYDFPLAATSGNEANVDPRRASFEVLLELGGNLPAQTTPPTQPEETPSAPQPAAEASGLPETGADLTWPALGAGVLLGLGALVLGLARRRAALRGHR